MYLHASDKASGVENFQSAVGSKPIRRKLVTRPSAKGFRPGTAWNRCTSSMPSPVKPLAVGVLGAGQQGLRLLAAVNPAFIDVKSIADLRPSNRSRASRPCIGRPTRTRAGRPTTT